MKVTEEMMQPADEYEKELIETVEKDGLVSRPKDEVRMKIIQEAARKKFEALDQEKKKQISLKVRESDLDTIKLKAKEVSIPYQNIIQALIHKYATGQIKLEI